MIAAMRESLEQLGFDAARLRFTMRTAIVACLAVLLAWLAGLEHPQWSGMTVWAASLPIRGHLLEKSTFRALGSIVGAGFGIALLLVSAGEPWIIILGLSVWIGLCAGAGNLVRGFASYGVMLAGYTAAMVALLHSSHSSDPFAVGIDRMLTVLLGVLAALVGGWLFAAPAAFDDLGSRVEALTRRVLRDLRDFLDGAAPAGDEHRHLLSEMALVEDGLDSHAAGSLRSREAARTIRRALFGQVGLVLWMRRGVRPAQSAAMIDALQRTADSQEPDQAGVALRDTARRTGDPVLAEALDILTVAKIKVMPTANGLSKEAGRPASALHRDWIGAREALCRSGFVVIAIGAVWLLTGWDGGPFMLLGAAIMTTIFSTFENPVLTLRQVLFGQTLGVVGALICRWLVWPWAESEWQVLLLMMPFILFGGVLFGHRRGSGPIGFDYNMVVLLLLQPAWPLAGSLGHSLALGAAVILGPAVGLMAFLLIFPVTGERRLKTLVAMMVREIEAMAARPGASSSRTVWRARLYHRVLRLVRWADKTGIDQQEAVDAALALLLTGSSVLYIDQLLQHPGTDSRTARRLNATRARLRRLGRDPQRAARALFSISTRLAAVAGLDAGLLHEAAVELSARSIFIREAGAIRSAPVSTD